MMDLTVFIVLMALDHALDSMLNLKEAHNIAQRIEVAIREDLGIEATIHMEPNDKLKNKKLPKP